MVTRETVALGIKMMVSIRGTVVDIRRMYALLGFLAIFFVLQISEKMGATMHVALRCVALEVHGKRGVPVLLVSSSYCSREPSNLALHCIAIRHTSEIVARYEAVRLPPSKMPQRARSIDELRIFSLMKNLC